LYCSAETAKTTSVPKIMTRQKPTGFLVTFLLYIAPLSRKDATLSVE